MKRTQAEFVFCNIDLPHPILSPMSTYNVTMPTWMKFCMSFLLEVRKGVDLNKIYKPHFGAFLGNINLIIPLFIIIYGAQAEKLSS